jgi:hypothetical protein
VLVIKAERVEDDAVSAFEKWLEDTAHVSGNVTAAASDVTARRASKVTSGSASSSKVKSRQ